jgi:protein required for attachment to host cells
MKLSKNVMIVVADGQRYLMLEKDAETPSGLRVVTVEEREVLRNVDLGEDRPGRFAQPSGRRETVEQTDWRRLEKEAFAKELAAEIAALGDRPVILAADPRTLGAVRAALPAAAAARVVGEIASDLTHHSVPSIAEAIAKA